MNMSPVTMIRELILEIYDLGGPVVLFLGAVSIATLSVVLYKLWQFRAAGVGRHKALREAVEAWDHGDRGGAHAALERSRSYLRPVVALAMQGGVDSARLDAEAETRFARLERGFRFLDGVAQLSPLVGLFGTVLGMIAAFQALQDAGSAVDPSLLAGGIWVALLTTAVGLAVAMPTQVVLSWLEARIDAERVLAGQAVRSVESPSGARPAADAPAGQAVHA
ncbi:biopolymer transporter ExbB [Salipiger pallidus]|uniref:Biopolymer transporter ExbB n=1 Tax=Salipiger pallidus TaxID=1775170 RepID=A0A8J2ZGR9_9RHOB|nr:MotA/TolQ/ExbB proton channel family protein [Salipiger pallidus]GGG62369.1 biopolymer transporter ExbB [Salipiger pallidus]